MDFFAETLTFPLKVCYDIIKRDMSCSVLMDSFGKERQEYVFGR